MIAARIYMANLIYLKMGINPFAPARHRLDATDLPRYDGGFAH